MFRVDWAHRCHECYNPIDVKLKVADENVFFLFRNFATHKPFCMIGNHPMIKYYGDVKCRRVCFSCYFSPRNHFDYLRHRETGRMNKPVRLVSKTSEQIYEWFSDFDDYRKRKDVEDCLMPHAGHVVGIQIYILSAFYSESDSD